MARPSLDQGPQLRAQPLRPALPAVPEVERQLRRPDRPVNPDRVIEDRRQLDLGDLAPSASRSCPNASPGGGLGLVPGRPADEGQPRLRRRRLGEHAPQRRGRGRAGRRVGHVEAGQHLAQQRQIVQRAREEADVVERTRRRQAAAARDQAEAGLQAVDAAERGGPDHRAVGLAPQRQRHHAGRDRRGRAARAAAGRAGRVVRVARRARGEAGVLGRDRLADDHRSRARAAGPPPRRRAWAVARCRARCRSRSGSRPCRRCPSRRPARRGGRPAARPRAAGASSASACARACAGSRWTQARRAGSSRPMRARQASTTSTALVRPAATSRTISVAEASPVMPPSPELQAAEFRFNPAGHSDVKPASVPD